MSIWICMPSLTNCRCVFVDSTRNGKRVPDALSKTIPIWCCVINHFLVHLNLSEDELAVHVPPYMVSATERNQIQEKIATFVEKLRVSLDNLGIVCLT